MNRQSKTLRQIFSLTTIDKISEFTGNAFSWLFLAASLIIFYSVIRRYVFNDPVVWGLELSLWLLIATYFFSGGNATKLHTHIRLDILYMHWSPRKKALVDVLITGPFLFLFCGIIMWQGGSWAWKALVTGERTYSLWGVHYWPVKIVIPLGAGLVFLQGVAEFIRDVRVLRTKENQK